MDDDHDPSELQRQRLIARAKELGLVEWQPTPQELIDLAREFGATKIGVDTGTGKATIRLDRERKDG